MAITASSRPAAAAGAQGGASASERSPFARLADLLSPYKPGKPLINMSLGEPQHPVPGFVGPVLAKHVNDLGATRSPRASSRSGRPPPTGQQGGSPSRAVDPETEVLVLNGSREGLFFAAIAAALCRAAQGHACDPDAQSVLSGLCRWRAPPDAKPVFLPTTGNNGFRPISIC
jgi:hypothetical protein